MRKFYALLTLVLISYSLQAQTSMSFYHFGDMGTFQNGSLNPAHTPDAKIFFSFVPNVHVHYNNKLSYNQLIRKEGTDNIVQVTNAISEMQAQNLLSAQAGIDLFHVGYSLPIGLTVSLYAKERMEGDFLYSKEFMEFMFEGSGKHLDTKLDLGASGISASHFREIGIGLAHQVNRQIRVGARFKILQGFYNFSTPASMEANVEVDPLTYAWTFNAQDVQFRTTGRNSYGNSSYLMSPGNGGMAIDFGFDFMVNRYLGFSGSIVDLGWINWKNDVSIREYQNGSFTYDGIDIKNVNDITEALQDSLFSKFTVTETTGTYKTWLPTTAYGSLIWKYTNQTTFFGSFGARYLHGQMKMLYGGGVRQKFGPMTFTLNAVKLPQHFFNVGAGFMVRGGPVQYYLAVDQVVNMSATDLKAIDVRTGINFLIGRRQVPGMQGRGGVTTLANNKNKAGKNKGVSTGFFLGEQVKTKRREGIYSIITRQKKREIPKSVKPPRIKKVSNNPAKPKLPRPTRRY